MHETFIARTILEHVEKRIRSMKEPALVEKVLVRVGEFTNVDPESLIFTFDSLKSLYEICRSSMLKLQTVQTLALCNDNGHEYHAQPDNSFRCPICGSGMNRLLAGQELDIVDIQIRVAESKGSS